MATVAGCGGAQVAASVDVRALLRDGKADEAIALLERQAAEAPGDPGVARLLFLAHAAARCLDEGDAGRRAAAAGPGSKAQGPGRAGRS